MSGLFLPEEECSHLWQTFSPPQLLGISLEGFLHVVQRKKEAQLYRNEIRHIFTAFDVHCKCRQSAFLEELLLRNREWGCIPCGAANMGHPYHTLTVATAVGGDLFLSKDAQFLALHEIFTIINWICVLAYCIVVGDNQRTGHMGVQATSQPWACGRHFATLTLTHT